MAGLKGMKRTEKQRGRQQEPRIAGAGLYDARDIRHGISQVLAQRFELSQRRARGLGVAANPVRQTMVDVIMDEFALGIADSMLDGMQLLSELDARSLLLQHGNDGAQMPLGTLQTFNDVGVTMVAHPDIISWGIGSRQASMWDAFLSTIGQMQSGIMRTLAAELRAGGVGAVMFAFALGALHALTPGHGKAALTAYFLGREARIGTGLRVALSAALLHVLSGFAAFLVLRFVLGQAPSISGRGSPGFTAFGYGLIILAGAMMLYQSFHPARHDHDGSRALIAGMGLLPCPLTISVLGFAWLQSSGAMVGLMLVSLSLGISATIGLVAVAAILGRATMGRALAAYLPQFERGARIVQGAAGAVIVAIGVYTLVRLKM